MHLFTARISMAATGALARGRVVLGLLVVMATLSGAMAQMNPLQARMMVKSTIKMEKKSTENPELDVLVVQIQDKRKAGERIAITYDEKTGRVASAKWGGLDGRELTLPERGLILGKRPAGWKVLGLSLAGPTPTEPTHLLEVQWVLEATR